MSTKNFAEKFIKAENEAFQRGDFGPLEGLEDPQVVYHFPFGDLVGWDAHKQDILTRRQSVRDLNQEWKYLTGEGNLLALSYKASCITTVEVMGIPAGKAIAMDYLFIIRIENGKNVESWANGSQTISDP